MDFFSKQDQARRKTWLLVLYFIFAIVSVVLVINAAVYVIFQLSTVFFQIPFPVTASGIPGWLGSDPSVYASITTVLVILGGSLYRMFDLADGGIAVAAMVGAKPLLANSLEANEKVLVNVVEEMAIASGMPVPQLFVMEGETSINAFVAGFRATESVLVVTRGTLDQLSRDELQGVVGHEFSHILNGDMRINLRLIAILFGILLIGKMGEWSLRGAKEADGRVAIFLIISGVLLYVAGYAGLFFGRIIKAAISRQREYLADASAVQFTRNSKGLAGALFKIKSSVFGARLASVYAEDLSHMCIGSTLGMDGWLATHPPLDERIHAIDPAYISTHRAKKIIEKNKAVRYRESVLAGNNLSMLTANVGNITAQQLTVAGEIHSDIPATLMHSVHAIEGAACVVYALLAAQNMPDDIQIKINKLREITDGLERRLRLPIIDLTLPQLKRMTPDHRQGFISTVEKIIKADNRYSLNEFVIFTIIKQHLSVKAGRSDVVKYHSFKPLLEDLRLLLSMMVICSGQSQQRKHYVFQRSIKVFTGADMAMYEKSVRPSQIEESLEKIRQTSMWLRKGFIDVCADIAMEDGIIMPAEAELLRAICESIDCPMPLLAA